MSVTVAVIDDGSVALRGAADVLRQSHRHTFLGTIPATDPGHIPSPVDGPLVLVADPFHRAGPGIAQLVERSGGLPILVMSAAVRTDLVRCALDAGVRGYVGKDIDVATLLAAIDAVGVGGVYLGVAVDDVLLSPVPAVDAIAARGSTVLTPREREVLVMVAKGLTHKQIGSQLNLSKTTVDTYVHRVRQKMGCVNKAGLTRAAIELNLLGN
jgi:DNA-binding NarL/FixJ family response regulator